MKKDFTQVRNQVRNPLGRKLRGTIPFDLWWVVWSGIGKSTFDATYIRVRGRVASYIGKKTGKYYF